MHHTVCGSEAINLAKRLTEELRSNEKRLTEELASQQGSHGSLGNTPTATVSTENSPEELRSRSLEQGEKSKGNILCAKISKRFFLFLSLVLYSNFFFWHVFVRITRN